MTAAGRACDCLNDCGDDPGLKDGKARPCAALARRRARKVPRAASVTRVNPRSVVVTYRQPVTDDQFDAIRDKLRDGGFE